MKIKLLLLSLVFSNFNLFAQQIVDTKVKQNLNKTSATFEENKGQMKDQNWLPRPDVLYYGSQEGMNYYIKNNGVSFQLSRVDSWREEESRLGMREGKKSKMPDQISTYRVDAHWIAHNPNFVVEKGKALDGYNNYYNVPDGVEPALFVKQFESVVLKNVWNGIDINYYGTNGQLETDYLVSPGSDYRDIQIEIKGAELSISNDGNLIMKTPFGEIQEGELKVFQEGERLNAFWKIGDNNRVSFIIPNFNPYLAMRIDPVARIWGTYYGGSLGAVGTSTATDATGNIYLAGYTGSLNAISSGGYQNTIGGVTDAYLVKFNSSGMRIWGTYYGGSNYDYGYSTVTDISGNAYLSGFTTSSNGIAFGGFQNAFGGGNNDAFLVKFNINGLRLWSTYYGGFGNEEGISTASDIAGNVYMSGTTNTTTGITSGGHQNTFGGSFDAYLVKFSSNGLRIWCTYYGGSNNEDVSAISADPQGNIYLAGITGSTNAMSSNGHQNVFGGFNDAFLVKFNSAGSRLWGTYYGGSGKDEAYATTTDIFGNVYLTGSTESLTAIASNGYQNTIGGTLYSDAFLVKFNSAGSRLWGTYYGGSGKDYGGGLTTDSLGEVIIAGATNSLSGIATAGFQNIIGGSYDAFIAKFTSTGVIKWGTYYGGTGDEDLGIASDNISCSSDNYGNIYIGGKTDSYSNIAGGGHQNIYSGTGSSNAFLAKFYETFITNQPPLNLTTCTNSAVTINVVTSGSQLTYQWRFKSSSSTQYANVPTGGANQFAGVSTNSLSIANPSGLNGYSFYCIVSNSFYSDTSTISTLTVYSTPVITTQPISMITCSNQSVSFLFSATGAGLSYQWQYRPTSIALWSNCTNGSIYNGYTSNNLQVLNPSGLNNYEFRCVVTNNNSCTSVSSTAILSVYSAPVINNQPVALSVCPNQPVTISLGASGTGLTYQWSNRNGSNGTWSNCINGSVYSGSTSNSLQILNTTGQNNYQFRCILTSVNGCTLTSNTAILTVFSNPTASITADGIAANPMNINLGDATALVLSGSLNSSNPNIAWSPPTALSSTNTVNPIAYPTTNTIYTATFTNSLGCTQSISQQVNVNQFPINGSISVLSGSSSNNFNVFDTLKIQVWLNGVSNIYAAYAQLRYNGTLAPYLTYIGYTAGNLLGTGSSVISTPPVVAGTYKYDFGISKIGPVSGYSGTGIFYTFLFKPNNIPSSLLNNQICFFLDNLSVTNSSGTAVGLINQGTSCFNFNNQANVWPGDLDNNKIVNTADLLKIGVLYNNIGPARPNASLQWIAQPTTLWGLNTSSPNSDAFKAFADGNGDGIINNADQASVGFNMGKIHALAQPLDSASFDRIATTGDLVVVPTPGYVSASAQSQQLDLSVSLANAGSTLNNLYGISFDIAVDTNVFDLQNTTFDYSGSIFGIPSQNFLKIEYAANGIVSVGMTRFNNPSINGNGLLCKIRLNTYSALNYSGTNLTFNGTVSAANDSIGMPYAISPSVVQIPYGSSSSITDIGKDISQVLLYPNPAGELLNVMINEEVFVKEIKVLDETGRVVIIKTPNSMIAKYTIETLNLTEGIYTIQLITKDGQIYKKFVKGE